MDQGAIKSDSPAVIARAPHRIAAHLDPGVWVCNALDAHENACLGIAGSTRRCSLGVYAL